MPTLPTDLEVRPATEDDRAGLAALSAEGFGRSVPDPPSPLPARARPFVACASGQPIARMTDLPMASWFGGRPVPTCGIASVVVAAEWRGRGLMAPLFEATLRAARYRGAVISGLYPTAPGAYRRFGYGQIAAYVEHAVPTAALAEVVAPTGADACTLERLDPSDAAQLAVLTSTYDRWAAAHNAPLTRADVPARPQDWIDPDPGPGSSPERATLARDADGRPVGYAVWSRRDGYRAEGVLAVPDLVALTPAAARTLLAHLGTHRSGAPTTIVTGAGEDLLPHLLPADAARPHARTPYLLTLLDVAGALEARGWPHGLSVSLPFRVRGHALADQDGDYVLAVTGGRAQVRRAETRPRLELTAAGLALLYAGTAPLTLRLLGLLTGDDADDEAWGMLTCGRRTAIRDYF